MPNIKALAASLDKRARSIAEKHHKCLKTVTTAVQLAADIGQELIGAKDTVKGAGLNWQKWVKDNLPFSHQQASKYIRAAAWAPQLGQNGNSSCQISLSEGVRVLDGEGPDDEPPGPNEPEYEPTKTVQGIIYSDRIMPAVSTPEIVCRDADVVVPKGDYRSKAVAETWTAQLDQHMADIEAAAEFLESPETKIHFLRRKSTHKKVVAAHAKWLEQVERVRNLHREVVEKLPTGRMGAK